MPAPAPDAGRSPRAWWGDRPVTVKVLAALGLTAVVAVLVGLLGLSALSATQQRQESLYADVTIPISYLGEIDATLQESNFQVSELLLQTDPAAEQGVLQEIADLDAQLDENLAAYTATDMTGREEARDGFAAALAEWRRIRDDQLVPAAQTTISPADFAALRAAQQDAVFEEANAAPRCADGHREEGRPGVRRQSARRLRVAAHGVDRAARDRHPRGGGHRRGRGPADRPRRPPRAGRGRGARRR